MFGGSGFYSFVDHLRPVEIDTPYGAPSEPPMVGDIDGRTVAFIPRHGNDHRIPAHRVNYRANIWAMAALGARALISPFACGSLRAELDRGDLVVVDQLVDRTHSREGTFFDGPDDVPRSAGRPVRPVAAGTASRRRPAGWGSPFTTAAPSSSSPDRGSRPGPNQPGTRQMGWDLVNMTQAPEAALAAEAGIPYVGIGLVTDFDAGLAERSNHSRR